MNVLFLTIGHLESIEDRDIYPDLLRTFRDAGHSIYTATPYEKRTGRPTELIESHGAKMLRVSIGNITKCGMIEKGISTIRIESQFLKAIKKHFKGVKFDLVLYSTPPITFAKVIRFIKKRDGAQSYLLLKDIFPQNAVDIGVMTKGGIKGLIYKFFRKKEKKLYAFSDRIGCMSRANVEYVCKHNPEVDPAKVEICPNAIEAEDMRVSEEERQALREKYGIPLDKKVFVYGGNLGKPQGIPFLMECINAEKDNTDAYFLIVGDGTEYTKLAEFFAEQQPQNAKLLRRLPKEDYDKMVAACDVGMIFLDYRFTIPNFPSRLLSYMQAGLPVLACTDPNTDIGTTVTAGGYGWWCPSNSPEKFSELVKTILDRPLEEMGRKSQEALKRDFDVLSAYNTIVNGLN